MTRVRNIMWAVLSLNYQFYGLVMLCTFTVSLVEDLVECPFLYLYFVSLKINTTPILCFHLKKGTHNGITKFSLLSSLSSATISQSFFTQKKFYPTVKNLAPLSPLGMDHSTGWVEMKQRS